MRLFEQKVVPAELGVDRQLRHLLSHFPSDPVGTAKRIRDLLEQYPADFTASAISELVRTPQSPALRYLAALLVSRNLMLGRVADPASLPIEHAVELCRLSIAIDPTFDRQLGALLNVPGCPVDQASHIIEILWSVSDGVRLLPLLKKLLVDGHSHLRSRVANFIARDMPDRALVEDLARDADPRVRANTVEALAASDSDLALKVLLAACDDPHHRVSANAYLGLHRRGATECVERLLEMTRHPDRQFRRSAAWAMGETGDPRYSMKLVELRLDPDRDVAATAVRSLQALMARRERMVDAARLSVGILGFRQQGNRRFVDISVTRDDGSTLPRISPLAFIASEDQRPLTRFQVESVPERSMVTLGFLLPAGNLEESEQASLDDVVETCLRKKRRSDRIAVGAYEPLVSGSQAFSWMNSREEFAAGAPETPPVTFAAEVDRIRAGAARLPTVRALPIDQAMKLMLDAFRDIHAAGHLVMAVTAGYAAEIQRFSGGGVWKDIAAKAMRCNIALHAVVAGGASVPVLEGLAAATGGHLLRAASAAGLPGLGERIYLKLRSHYLLSYTGGPVGLPHRVGVEVWSPAGMGRDVMTVG